MKPEELDKLLVGEEPKEVQAERREFKPKFNVREEFALWIREQFPELKEYAKKGKTYQALEERKDEVYQAGLGAVNHGASSTMACASARLQSGWTKFEKGFEKDGTPRKRANSLEKFVEALEDLSISLGGDKHFTEAGQYLGGGSWQGNLIAFVYRVGNESAINAKYLVFDTSQKFDGENAPVLIGELSQLTEWNVKDLQKIAKDFRGSESMFIEEVDRRVPQAGTYSYSTYDYGYGRSSAVGKPAAQGTGYHLSEDFFKTKKFGDKHGR